MAEQDRRECRGLSTIVGAGWGVKTTEVYCNDGSSTDYLHTINGYVMNYCPICGARTEGGFARCRPARGGPPMSERQPVDGAQS